MRLRIKVNDLNYQPGSTQIKFYPDLHIILTSRPLGYRASPLESPINTYEIQDYSLADMKRFVRAWYTQHEMLGFQGIGVDPRSVFGHAEVSANNLISTILNNRPLRRMALNPLLLTMIVSVHANRGILQNRRVELYKEVFEVLLNKRQYSKNITDNFSIDQKLQILRPIALWLMLHNQKRFTAVEVEPIIKDSLNRISNNPISSDEFLIYLAETSGLISPKEEEGRYEFTHLTFQEYLASCEIVNKQRINILLRSIVDPAQLSWWSETICFSASQMDASEIVRTALSSPSIDTIQLAFECINDCLEIDPSIRIEFQDLLESFRKSSDQAMRLIASSLILRTEI
jgi:predicted NACHT family NTPase